MGFDFHKNRDRVGGVSEIRGGLNTQIALGLRPKATKGQFRWSHLISQTIFYNFNLAKTVFVIYIMPQPDEGHLALSISSMPRKPKPKKLLPMITLSLLT